MMYIYRLLDILNLYRCVCVCACVVCVCVSYKQLINLAF